MADTRLQMLEKIGSGRNPVEETEYQNLLKASGVGSAQSISMDDLGGSSLAFAEKLNEGQDAAFNAYVMAQRAQKRPLEVFTALEEAAGLPGMKKTAQSLQESVNSLEDTLRGMEGQVAATTRESLVTEGQRAGMVQARSKPFLRRLGEVSTALGRLQGGISSASADISNKTGLVLQGNELELDPYRMRIQIMADRAARLMTGFSDDRQTKLTLLMDKLGRQRQLDDREWQEASQLAQEERAYTRELEKTKNQAPETQLVDIGGQKLLINSGTGEIISKYGSPAGTGFSTDKYYSSQGGSGYYSKGISGLWGDS